MDYEQSVVEFLAQPENLPAVLEVARRVEQVRDHLQIRFWHMYRDEMQRRLNALGGASNWKISLPADKNLLNAWTKCSIHYAKVNRGALHLTVSIEASKSQWGSPLIYGLNWSQIQQEVPSLPEVASLQQALRLRNAQAKTSEWWLNYQELDTRLREDGFLMRFVSGPDTVVHEVTDLVWTLFTQIQDPLESLNVALSRSQIVA